MVADSHVAPKKPHKGGLRTRIPLPVRLKIRALYVVQQISPSEIALQIGYTKEQVQGVIFRAGWVAVKNSAKRKLEERDNTRLQAEIDEVQDAFGAVSEELGLRSLDKLSDSLDRRDPNAARDSQAYSQTAKNLYGIVRQARNLDTQQQEGKLGSVVVFLGDLPRVSREEKRVLEVEVSLTPSAPTPTDAPSKPKEPPVPQGVIEDTGSGVATD